MSQFTLWKTFIGFIFMSISIVPAVSAQEQLATNGTIEIVTFKLKPGIKDAEFSVVNQLISKEHVAKQPGFISRESAIGADNEWLVVVHWKNSADAEASMASFTQAPAASTFMQMIDASTMKMKRYQSK